PHQAVTPRACERMEPKGGAAAPKRTAPSPPPLAQRRATHHLQIVMASFGHLAVGLVAGRLHGGADSSARPRATVGTMLAFAALAVLPDFDVVGVACGLSDGGPGGHRGASHSLVLAIAVGLVSALVARRFGWPVVRTVVAA